MSTSEYGRLRQELIEELKALARDRGVEREDDQLLGLLNDRLQILCRAWRIDLRKGAAEVRAEIRKRLDEHLSEITPVDLRPGVNSPYPKLRGAERKTQFERVIRVIFNVDPDLAYGFSETGTEDRLTWLTSPANRANGIDYSLHAAAAQRDYERAREKIAEALAEREQTVEVLATSKAQTPQRLNTSTSIAKQATGISIFGRRRIRPRAVLIGILAIVLVSGSITALRLVGDTKAPATKVQTPPAGPITVLAQYSVENDNTWVFPQALRSSDTARINSYGFEYTDWAPKMGGALFSSGTYKLTITGNRASGVTITGMSVDLLKKRPSLNGALIYITGQGVVIDQDISFNLDSNPPIALDAGAGTGSQVPYFQNRTINLAINEPITIDVNVSGLKYDYIFDLVIAMDVQGTQVKYTVSGPGGQPFQVSGEARSYDAVFVPTHDLRALQFESSSAFCAQPEAPCGAGGS